MSTLNTIISNSDANAIQMHVLDHQEHWQRQLKSNPEDSLFFRPKQTGLKFSIQYWKDGEWLIYTKIIKGSGGSKKTFVCIDLKNQKLLARIKPNHFSEESVNAFIKEAELIDTFKGKRGIIQNYKTSFYLGKIGERKFHIIQDLCDGTFSILPGIILTVQQAQKSALDLMHGVHAIHKRGLLHDDLKDENILIKIDPMTNEGIEVIICDLGSIYTIQDDSLHSLDFFQRKEAERALQLALRLFRNTVSLPAAFDNLFGIPDSSVFRTLGLFPKPPASAQEILDVFAEEFPLFT